jgi:hypothetical protein
MVRIWCGALVTAVLVAAGSPATAAEVGTPPPARDAPPPALCRAAPRSLAELNGLSATPATVAAPAIPRPRDVVPQGRPADPATVAGVTATVRELVACFNAGELLRAYGLYTDPYLHRLLKRQDPMTLLAYDALATPMPEPPASSAAILAIRDVRLLPDGTAGATVTIQYAVVPMPKTFFIVFARAGGRWLIADILGEISFSVP